MINNIVYFRDWTDDKVVMRGLCVWYGNHEEQKSKRKKGKRKEKCNQSCVEEDFQIGEALTFFCDFFSTTPNFRP